MAARAALAVSDQAAFMRVSGISSGVLAMISLGQVRLHMDRVATSQKESWVAAHSIPLADDRARTTAESDAIEL
jgi:hypothetical protein